MSPLHLATEGGHLEVVKALLEAGANPNAEDIKGKTCLHVACKVYAEDETGDFVWEDLIEAIVKGGGVSIKDVDGKLPDPGEDAVMKVVGLIEKAFKDGKEARADADRARKEKKAVGTAQCSSQPSLNAVSGNHFCNLSVFCCLHLFSYARLMTSWLERFVISALERRRR